MNKNLFSKKILIVDDTPENILLLEDALSDFRLSKASNAEEAIEGANSFDPPDLILLDIVMPGKDGYEVCQKLKSSDKTKDIPIIFLTFKNDEESESKGLKMGAVDYIAKPFSVAIVKNRVKLHLELNHTRETLENQNAIFELKIKDLEKKLNEKE